MSESKHTPGPWTVQELEKDHHGYNWPTFAVRSNPANHCLAIVGEIDRATAPQNAANARLIAAAPRMLEGIDKILTLAFKHEVQYWLNAPGTDAEKLAQIVTICRDLRDLDGAA